MNLIYAFSKIIMVVIIIKLTMIIVAWELASVVATTPILVS